ncbi:unnamed protein product [Schistosoma margrebowiei]|uniref:Uncharacterized protein n=1 Tax=Schistosoma margrebowiei TaxID=48269 RepID=A0A183MW36_9TREM|nr:unnamed protein product [Schistosoma margrebowiei]
MKTSASEGKHGIECTARMQLDDLDFADDLALLSQSQQQIHEKTISVAVAPAAINEHLGPLQISLGNMLIDITKFIFIFLLVISSFACGLHQLYYYYLSNEEDNRPRAFSS